MSVKQQIQKMNLLFFIAFLSQYANIIDVA